MLPTAKMPSTMAVSNQSESVRHIGSLEVAAGFMRVLKAAAEEPHS
jgi:hypothetical protein